MTQSPGFFAHYFPPKRTDYGFTSTDRPSQGTRTEQVNQRHGSLTYFSPFSRKHHFPTGTPSSKASSTADVTTRCRPVSLFLWHNNNVYPHSGFHHHTRQRTGTACWPQITFYIDLSSFDTSCTWPSKLTCNMHTENPALFLGTQLTISLKATSHQTHSPTRCMSHRLR